MVLSTGDLRGVFAHAGFLMALEKLGISYQAMAGSSAGAIVAAIVGSGKPVREFAEWLNGLKVEDYWERDPLWTVLYHMVFRRGRGYTGIVSTDPLEQTIAGLLQARTLESCPISLYLVATNITTGSMEVFHSGEIAPRAVASAAIP
ncbi:MAG TPA: patatin-like phospholipase family protein, partial [Nitrospiria bacterium]